MFYEMNIKRKNTSKPIFCRRCGMAVSRNDFAMVYSEKALCDSCISELDLKELLRICEFPSKEYLLYSIGFKKI